MIETWNVFREKWISLWKTFFFWCYLPSLACLCFVELCSRKSVLGLLLFLIREPLVFLYNGLIIAATASVCLLFRRRIFVLSVVLFSWLVIGVTNLVLLIFRTTPFTAVDFALLKDALAIANRYLSWLGVALIILGILLVIAFCGWLYCKAKKEESKICYKMQIPFCGLLLFLCLLLTDIGMAAGLLDRNFGNLAQAFHENGLPYCFMNSVLNTGIERPDNYSSETMGKLFDAMEEEEGWAMITEPPVSVISPAATAMPEATPTPSVSAPETTPTVNVQPTEVPAISEIPEPDEPAGLNIIFLQLESFFDVKHIENISCTVNPVPYFTFLRDNYPSGYLEVPSIGAGTANTEFECITGMNLDLFGPGEYPYKTLLKNRTCESMAYILKNLGYAAGAIHNNDGTFYNRHEVFSKLGFDRYISIEYMQHIERNELGWAKDRGLTEQIMKQLSATEERDYIYAISVQGHGAYPEEPVLQEKKLDIQLPEELADYYYQYLYYVHQLKEMDTFIGELTLTLSAWKEDTVLVLYGDHLPGLGLTEELLDNGNIFQTEYVIWSNFGLQAEDKALHAYQLSARVLQLLGIEEGIMPQYHMYREEDEDYLENMQLLMYDMLYGKMQVYNGVNPYEPTNLQMGIDEITIQEVYRKDIVLTEEEPFLYVTGQNFTEWSKVVINEKSTDTIFLTDGLLAVRELPESDDGIYRIKVCQQGMDEIVLSETETVEYHIR